MKRWKITTSPDDLQEGLFGQVVLWTFEVLPYLAKRDIYPAWDLKSKLYGSPPDYTVVPGVLDLAYEPPAVCDEEISLGVLRDKAASVLGGDWRTLHDLWSSYFVVPPRITAAADAVDLGERALGLHYRGTDKNESLWDTNPVSQVDFLTLARGFLSLHPEVTSVFVASDEFSFVAKAEQELSELQLVNLGEVTFHKSTTHVPLRADRAMLDCVLLSRCRYVLKCSSALSGFAKVLNPGLELYRVSASKLFADIPYFPEAYVPRLRLDDPDCARILDQQFAGDWVEDPRARARFEQPFAYVRRHSRVKQLARRVKRRTARS